jgi:pSer/pThr/pTyr-binding forkhead associated (FHA) protein
MAPPPPMPPVAKPPTSRMNIPESAMEGTVVFSGLRAAPRTEVKISEKKPDGSIGKTVPVAAELSIGREGCDLTYPEDMLLSPRHASVTMREGSLVLTDLNSQNGSFIRQRQDTELAPGDVFLLGRELFRFVTQSLDESMAKEQTEGTMMWSVPKLQKGPLTSKLEHIKLNGEVVAEFKLDKPETTLGRTQGDLVFKDDPYMSGMHARIVAQPGRFLLQDLRSRNGVYRRVREETVLTDGDEFFMGEQLFHVDIKNAG